MISMVVAALLAGCGKSSTPTSATPNDSQSPSPPSGVTAVVSPSTGISTLTWLPSPDADVASYDVFIYQPSPLQDNTYVPVAHVDASVTSLALPLLPTNESRWYRVQCTNNGGNKSALTSPTNVLLGPISNTGGTGGGTGGGGGGAGTTD